MYNFFKKICPIKLEFSVRVDFIAYSNLIGQNCQLKLPILLILFSLITHLT